MRTAARSTHRIAVFSLRTSVEHTVHVVYFLILFQELTEEGSFTSDRFSLRRDEGSRCIVLEEAIFEK